MCQVYLLTALDFSLALLACKLVHTRCMCRNWCSTPNLERWTLGWDWEATPHSHMMHPAARSLHGRHTECPPLAHLASCPLHGGTNTAPACVLHCLLSRSTFHIIAIHCLMLRPYPWAPNTYLSSGFLTGEGKDESSVPKTTVSLKHAMPKLGSSVLVASLHLQKPVTSCPILWAKHTALSSNGSGSLRAFLRIDRRFLTSLCQKASVCAA